MDQDVMVKIAFMVFGMFSVGMLIETLKALIWATIIVAALRRAGVIKTSKKRR